MGGTETIYEPLKMLELLKSRRWGSRWQRMALCVRLAMGWAREMATRDRPERPVAAFMRMNEAIVRVWAGLKVGRSGE
jgi:hypothetical protein